MSFRLPENCLIVSSLDTMKHPPTKINRYPKFKSNGKKSKQKRKKRTTKLNWFLSFDWYLIYEDVYNSINLAFFKRFGFLLSHDGASTFLWSEFLSKTKTKTNIHANKSFRLFLFFFINELARQYAAYLHNQNLFICIVRLNDAKIDTKRNRKKKSHKMRNNWMIFMVLG